MSPSEVLHEEDDVLVLTLSLGDNATPRRAFDFASKHIVKVRLVPGTGL